MDITLGYAIAVGGVLIILVLFNHLGLLSWLLDLVSWARPFCNQAFRYLAYPYLVRRHRFWGPWTLGDLIIQLVYIGSNSFCLGFRANIAQAGLRAGTLSVVNLIPLFLGPHLSFLADILGVSLNTFRYMHRSAALMSSGLVLFHALTVISRTAFALHGAKNRSAVVAASSLGFIVVLSWPPLRKRFYEIFLRSHQILAATVAISALLHVPSMLFPRLYFYIALGIFATISAVEGILFLPHNIIFTRSKDKKGPRVEEIFKYSVDDNKNPGDSDKIPVQLAIVPKEPLGMKAGQYINLCIPSLGLRSSLQSHPFVVASWTGKQQTVLELLIEPRNGWTKKLHSRAIDVSGQSGGLGRVWFTGPHGRPVRVEGYEYIFMVATEYGIAPHLPLLERLVQGTLAREVRARRIRLVWVVEDTWLYKTVFSLLNWILIGDRMLGDNCTLVITFYSKHLAPEKISERAQISDETFCSEKVLKAEIANINKRKEQEEEAVEAMIKMRAEEKGKGRKEVMDQLYKETMEQPKEKVKGRKEVIDQHYEDTTERPDKGEIGSKTLPVYTNTPRMLITVSASTTMRDELRSALKTSLNEDITLVELDYQPSD